MPRTVAAVKMRRFISHIIVTAIWRRTRAHVLHNSGVAAARFADPRYFNLFNVRVG